MECWSFTRVEPELCDDQYTFQMFRLSLRLMLTLVLMAGIGKGQEEVEFPSDDETVDIVEDIGDLSYDSEASISILL